MIKKWVNFAIIKRLKAHIYGLKIGICRIILIRYIITNAV